MPAINPVKIKNVRISNFRSFAQTDKDLFDKDLAGINLFIGPNGGGKSNFFNAIRWCVGWHSFNSQGTYDLQKNYNNENEPIDIRLSFNSRAECHEMSLHADASLGRECWEKAVLTPDVWVRERLKQRIFPIGLPRQFRQIWDRKDSSYEKIKENWSLIREDAARINVMLPDACPRLATNDRVFFEVVDSNGVSWLEGSDGISLFLYLIVHIRILEPGSIVLIEEPDVSMHPGLQKQFLDYLKYLASADGGSYQFLITTHSPYLMDFAAIDSEVALYRAFKNESKCTQIELLEPKTEKWELLKELGHIPSDVMQPNGIIWVEGPSDAIYIETWLQRIAPNLTRPRDYEILWYGGANISHIGVDIWDSSETPKKIMDLLNLSRNFFFIVDSDSHLLVSSNNRTRKRAETMKKHKESVLKNCTGENSWIPDPYIEKYVKDYMSWDDMPRQKKPEYAQDYQKKIKELDNTQETQFLQSLQKSGALQEIRRLKQIIEKWQSNHLTLPE